MLSRRQQTILELLAEGRTRREIAEVLSVSPHTVKAHIEGHPHMEGLLSRLGARNSAHAVSLGYRYGLLRTRRPIVNVEGPDSMRWSA